MKQAAAIKRASQQARNAMYTLDAKAAAELLVMYERAALDVRARIAGVADAAGNVPVYQLQELLRQIEAVIDGLTDKRNGVLVDAIEQAAALGVRPYTAQGALAVGGTHAVLSNAAASTINQNAVKFVMDFVQADGLTLSDRLWRLDRGAKEALTRQIGMAVVQGHSATQAARELVMRGEAVPADMAQRLARGQAPALASAADMLKNPNGGDGYWQAERVMRTEINRAHGEAFMAAGEGTPGFAGWRYLLSPRHPAPDICDLLASQNLHGLGEGVYRSRQATPWPAHPNTLSFLEIVFASEVTDADRAGKETSLQALARLPVDKRQGALGVTKAAYFDRGLLSKKMIRSPLKAVEQRLQRQGKL
jgi:hypothetical protein